MAARAESGGTMKQCADLKLQLILDTTNSNSLEKRIHLLEGGGISQSEI
jgi:hypothetical protein